MKLTAEEKEWKRTESLDEAHKRERRGHQVVVEQQKRCGVEVERPVCSCGWTGEWRKA